MQASTNNPGAEATKANADKHALETMPAIKAAIAAGASGLGKMAVWLNAQGVPAPRGGKWRTETVRRMRQRLVDLGYDELKVKPRPRFKLSALSSVLSPEALAMHNALMMEVTPGLIAQQKLAGKL